MKTKEQKLLIEVFKIISKQVFTDFKLLPWYISKIEFNRTVGSDISDYIENMFPYIYKKEKLKFYDKSN